MTIMGSVTVSINADGTVTLVPPMGQLDRNIQIMQWSLAAPADYQFAAEPIVFQSTNLPEGYIPWSGGPILRENNWQVRANANLNVHGNKPVFYRYDIWVERQIPNGPTESIRIAALHPATLEKIDPDMENNPQP